MPNDIIYLNGKHPMINNDDLEISFRTFLGTRVSNSKLYIFSNFSAPISSECKIDILVIMSIEDVHGNYLRVEKDNSSFEYYRNTILPITLNSSFYEQSIEIRENYITINDYEYENKDEISALKFGLKNLLELNCFFEKDKVQINPIEILLNKTNQFVFDKTIDF